MSEDEKLDDIYQKVMAEAVEFETDALCCDDEYLREMVGEYLGLREEEAAEHIFTSEEIEKYLTDYLSLEINYPEELQELYDEDEEVTED